MSRARELVPCPLALPWVPLQPPSFSMIIWLPHSISVAAQCSCQACNGRHSSSNNKEWQRRGLAEIIQKEPQSSRGVTQNELRQDPSLMLTLFLETNFDRKQCHWCVTPHLLVSSDGGSKTLFIVLIWNNSSHRRGSSWDVCLCELSLSCPFVLFYFFITPCVFPFRKPKTNWHN